MFRRFGADIVGIYGHWVSADTKKPARKAAGYSDQKSEHRLIVDYIVHRFASAFNVTANALDGFTC